MRSIHSSCNAPACTLSSRCGNNKNKNNNKRNSSKRRRSTGTTMKPSSSIVIASVAMIASMFQNQQALAFSPSSPAAIQSSSYNNCHSNQLPNMPLSASAVPVHFDGHDRTDRTKTVRKQRKQKNSSSLFQTYATFRSIQAQLTNLNLKDAPVYEQAAALSMSIRTLQRTTSEGNQAREILLLENMGLVHHVVNKRFQHSSSSSSSSSSKLTKSKNKSNSGNNNMNSIVPSKDDLIQEGMIGLAKALDKYDPHHGAKFSTYAVYWIQSYINRYVQSRDQMVHIPEYLQLAIRKIEAVARDVQEEHHEEEHGFTFNLNSKSQEMVQILVERTGLADSVVKHALKFRRMMYNTNVDSILELEDWMTTKSLATTDGVSGSADAFSAALSSSSSSSVASLSESGGSSSIDREGHLDHFKATLGQFISMKEMEALSWRYGLLEQQQQQQQQEQGLRDYEAEAESDLFGPNGILNAPPSSSSVSTSPIVGTIRTVAYENNSNMASSIQTSTPSSAASPSTPKKQQQALKKGGRWGEAMSFSEVGEQMRVSAEYGRRLCSSALKKLKMAAEEGRLDPAMLF